VNRGCPNRQACSTRYVRDLLHAKHTPPFAARLNDSHRGLEHSLFTIIDWLFLLWIRSVEFMWHNEIASSSNRSFSTFRDHNRWSDPALPDHSQLAFIDFASVAFNLTEINALLICNITDDVFSIVVGSKST
jgi:hypothetical protein